MNAFARIKELCSQALNSEIPNEEALIRIHEIALEHEAMEK